MTGRVVLFGATGYTGELAARALVGRGVRPVLAARSEQRVRALADELGGLEHMVADVSQPVTVRALVERGDVLVSTVGPFSRWGDPALEAAIAAGAHYIDSTGETAFIRSVFEQFGPRAQAADCALLTAMGYDWVPGNLAAALALTDAGAQATRVEVGYYFTGEAGPDSMSGGTRASAAGAMLDRSFAWRDGRLVTERGARRVRSFDVGGRERLAISVGTTEHLSLPAVFPQLRDVGVFLGWFGPASRAMQVMSAGISGLTRLPGARGALQSLTARTVKGSTGGPDAASREKSRSFIVAEAQDASGNVLAKACLEGVNGYTFTGEILAWAAEQAAAGAISGTGALGPVEAFGLEGLERGVAEAGLTRD